MTIEHTYNFKRMSERVDTAGALNETILRQLGDYGYQVVINLLPDSSDHAVDAEASLVCEQGIVYEYIPVDFSAPSRDDYAQFSKLLSLYSSRKVLAHCAANYRVSAFYALHAYQQLGWTQDQVHGLIDALWTLSPLDQNPAWAALVSDILAAPRPA
ncbi:MAG TPA: protein tyrosine phosphatase family protein [Spongiibacteraceae bacterium]|jgi:protein tyrosine phosphatase (PTP) superfamily phosphohydrolase (DUF442 family)|nr:protein tyrosine phosphatase family protein [Spongiibacteraceae bacterium]HUH36775.1 protein tyrosine phosphatase family protein [Spongiibacteraceae bacterium]